MSTQIEEIRRGTPGCTGLCVCCFNPILISNDIGYIVLSVNVETTSTHRTMWFQSDEFRAEKSVRFVINLHISCGVGNFNSARILKWKILYVPGCGLFCSDFVSVWCSGEMKLCTSRLGAKAGYSPLY